MGCIRDNIDIRDLLDLESKKCVEYFWNEANTDEQSAGYGLVRDRAPSKPFASSIAATGFGLTALTIGVERNWLSKRKAIKRASGTLDTLLHHAEHVHGFFYHFLDVNTAKRIWGCEVSVMDTAIALCGAITAGEYFGGSIKEKAAALYKRMDWHWFLDEKTNCFHLGYTPEEGFYGSWDSYAEQFMMYFFALGGPDPVETDLFYSFQRDIGSYKGGKPFIHSYLGTLFTYQFSHAWFDLRHMVDREGVDWWENSVLATEAARAYGIDHKDSFKTFGPHAWGLTACDGPAGYSGLYGSPPRKTDTMHEGNDGTVAVCGALGSIVFMPEAVKDVARHYFQMPGLWGKYGLKDAFNFDMCMPWIGQDVIGIDKGISLLMIENERSGFVWRTFMKNRHAQKGLKKAGFRKVFTALPQALPMPG